MERFINFVEFADINDYAGQLFGVRRLTTSKNLVPIYGT